MNQTKKLFTSFIALMISGSMVLSLLLPSKTFSDFENRYLQQMPKFNWEQLISGKYMQTMSLYMKDQFPFKNQAVFIKGFFDQVFLKQENNDIFIGKDGHLFQKYIFNSSMVEANIDALNHFIKANPDIDISFMLIPNASAIYQEKLPHFAVNDSQLEALMHYQKQLLDHRFIDVLEILNQHKDEYIYFNTDHHWTMKGAYYGYVSFCKSHGITPVALEEFSAEKVSDDFYGSYYFKVMRGNIKPDELNIYKLDYMNQIQVIVGNDEIGNIFDTDKLDTEEKYSYFLGGNQPLVTLTNHKLEKGDELLILKDSYAHAMIPFLTSHFKKIHVIDTRYYKLSVQEYLENNHISEILMIHNVDYLNSTKIPKIY